jgi:gliding motility-associated lipoprotein GldD
MKFIKFFSVMCFIVLLLCAVFFGCAEEQSTPKPPTYLRINFPDNSPKLVKDNCPYLLQLPAYATAMPAGTEGELACHKTINLGVLNGTIHFSFIPMKESLGKYIDFAIDKIDEHKVKATAIEDTLFINSKTKVFGALYELQGDVASPFQFYMTDSTKRFVSGVVYFNAAPNYDSMRPTLQYLRKDLIEMMKTFEWK